MTKNELSKKTTNELHELQAWINNELLQHNEDLQNGDNHCDERTGYTREDIVWGLERELELINEVLTQRLRKA